MKKGNSPLINGFILGAVFLYLIWYFSTNDLWNPATVVVEILLAGLTAMQIIIWFMYFRSDKSKKNNKNRK